MLLIHGPDNFRSREYLEQLKKRFIQKYDPQRLNLVILDYEREVNQTEILKKVSSILFNTSFFGKKRLVIIQNFFSVASLNEQKKLINLLCSSLKKLQDSILIFYEKQTINPQRVKALPLKIYHLKPLQLAPLRKWVEQRIKSRGGTIAREALEKLCFEVGNNLAKMEQEINKLLNYQKNITLESVNLLVEERDEDNIFLLTDALAQRDKKRALRLLEDQLRLNQHPLYLLKMFAFAFRNLLIVKELLNKNFSSSTIRENTHLHPYLLQKLIQQAQKFNFLELKRLYLKLIDLDYAIKTGKIEAQKGLEIFIALL